jgi:hypothetical protein
MAARWRLVWTWAGFTGEATDIAPDFTQTADLYGAVQSASSVTIAFVPRGIRSVATVVNGGIPLYTGTGDLYLGDVLVISGRWSAESEYGVDGDPIVIVLSESWEDDGALWPPLGELPRAGADAALDQLAGTRPGIVSLRTWPLKLQQSGQGAGYPFVIGSPGTSVYPGSPAPVIADGSVTAIAVMAHAGPTSGTATLWGPTRTVDHAAENVGSEMIAKSVTLSMSTDGLGCEVASTAFNAGAATYPGWSATGASYYFSWDGTATGHASGAGDVLVSVLESSGARVDMGAARACRPALNRYRLDGYADDRVPALEWAQRQLVPILPIALVPGPLGLTPVLWPWLDQAEDARFHLQEGPGFVRGANRVGYSQSSGVSAVRISYGWCPSDGVYVSERTAAARDTLRGRVAASLLQAQGATQQVETRLVWDHATAERIADDRLARAAVPRRTVGYQCDPSVYGAGGRWELRVGMPITLTDAGLHLARVPAFVRRIERAGDRMRVDIDLRDDGMHPLG